MWVASLFVLLVMPQQRWSLLWSTKAYLILYSVAVIGFRLYLWQSAKVSPQALAEVFGGSEPAARVLAQNTGTFAAIGSWLLWAILPAGYFALLLQNRRGHAELPGRGRAPARLSAGEQAMNPAAWLSATSAWRAAHPGAALGVLALRGVANPPRHATLDERKAALERALRERYAGQDRGALAQHPVLRAYAAYYKRFKKTYHVQHQLESVVFKGKSLPNVAALVEAMFMAELEDLLLTAGHDLDRLALPLTLDVAQGTETYTLLRGDPQTLKAGDMYIRDGAGVISSILYGPDRRTQITPETRNVVFTVYTPVGVGAEAVDAHLRTLEANVRLVAPGATAVHGAVLTAA